MNKGMLSAGIIILALMSLLLVNVLSNYSTGSEVDFYLVKETTENALRDSLDDIFYSQHGVLRMDREKFVESFIRRFADNVDTTRNYTIGFYGLNEVPPKVSVRVDSLTVLSFDGDHGNISTTINQLVEMPITVDDYLANEIKDEDSPIGSPMITNSENSTATNIIELFPNGGN